MADVIRQYKSKLYDDKVKDHEVKMLHPSSQPSVIHLFSTCPLNTFLYTFHVRMSIHLTVSRIPSSNEVSGTNPVSSVREEISASRCMT